MDFQAILPEIISVGVVLLFGTVISIGVILHLRKLYYSIKSDIYEALRNEAMVHQGDEKHETEKSSSTFSGGAYASVSCGLRRRRR